MHLVKNVSLAGIINQITHFVSISFIHLLIYSFANRYHLLFPLQDSTASRLMYNRRVPAMIVKQCDCLMSFNYVLMYFLSVFIFYQFCCLVNRRIDDV